MKLVVLDGYTLNPGDLSWDGLEKLGELHVYDRTSTDAIIERCEGAKIVFTNKTPLTRETLSALKELKYIGVLATGYNVVDIEAAKEFGIVVTNIPTYGTAAVSQFVFALLLEICHHVGAHSEKVKEGAWSNCEDFCFWDYPLIELSGKTMGIVGMGRIGKESAKIAQALGMNVLACDHHIDTSLESDTLKYVELHELYRASDIVNLHCPLDDKSKGMINRETIGMMKDGVMIINTSRGPLIVEQDLADALNSGKVYAAAVDVVSTEPAKMDNPLIHAKNCIITPHIAWAPIESRARLMTIAVNNLESFLNEMPINVVNA
jgi:glycerate dehydrogenase